jgi:hypothetical protein
MVAAVSHVPSAESPRPATATAVLVSVLIPLEDHRSFAERSIQAWCREQTLDRDRYEVIVMAPAGFPKAELARIEALLGKGDRLLPATSRHDVELVAAGAAFANGEFLMFSESHVRPSPDLLERCIARMDDHPEWAALVCGMQSLTENRLGHVEAAMYERDFKSGLANLHWRNINDAGFLTRRAPYLAVGGFDGTLGHFAEWLLAARYATEGFVVGQCPDIEMWHLYTGDLVGLRAFTEDHVRGEIEYLARNPALRREALIEAPIEWSARGDRRCDLARDVLRLIAGEVVQARKERRIPAADWRLGFRWAAAAIAGGRFDRVAAFFQVLARRAHLMIAERFASQPALARSFERYIAAVIRRARLRRCDELVARRQPARGGELWNASPEGGDAGAGFHDCERLGDVPFRWSQPVAVIGLDLLPGRYVVRAHTLAVQLADSAPPPALYFNGRRISDLQISGAGNTIGFRVDVRAAGGNWLGVVCPPRTAPGDARLLGLPFVSVLATLDDG